MAKAGELSELPKFLCDYYSAVGKKAEFIKWAVDRELTATSKIEW